MIASATFLRATFVRATFCMCIFAVVCSDSTCCLFFILYHHGIYDFSFGATMQCTRNLAYAMHSTS